jgi:hypothetical protein
VLPPGVTEEELLAACIGPELDSLTAKACLAELKQTCLYLHFDGLRYCFKQDPNVTLLMEQEADAVARDEKQVTQRIREMLEKRLAGRRAAIIWPEKSLDIPDKDRWFLIAYLPLDFAGKSANEQSAHAVELFEKLGDKPRSYKNGIALAVPSADQIEPLRCAVHYLIAAARVKEKAKQHNLTDEQMDELKERESTERAAAESALLKLYTEAWLPRFEGGKLAIEKVAVGGRPLQITVSEQKEALIHERMTELLTNIQPRIFGKVTPAKIVDLFKLGEASANFGIKTADVVDGFFSFLGFTRLVSSDVVRRAVAAGVKDGIFGYMSGNVPTLDADGKYHVAAGKVRIGIALADDEIDLDDGFLMLPRAIQEPQAVLALSIPIPEPGSVVSIGGSGQQPLGDPAIQQPVIPSSLLDTRVMLSFAADRNQLYAAWNALANLADMAGKVSISISAESPAGFDKGKLENGVFEPLREADLLR